MIESQTPKSQRIVVGLLLALTILIGAGLRLYNPLWDLATFPHPDERSTLLIYATRIRWPDNSADVLDPRKSTLNPFWDINAQDRQSYTYGHFPLYGLIGTSALLTKLTPYVASFNAPQYIIDFFEQASTGRGYTVVGRLLVGLLDTGSIYLVFLIARRLYGHWAGLLAAALSAFAVFHIQLAHFFAVDPVSTTFVLLTIYGAMLMLDRRTAGSALVTGVAIGLAVSSKYSALPIVLAPAMAGLYIAKDRTHALGGITSAFRLLVIAAITSFITFAMTSPFVLLDYEIFRWAVIEQQGTMVSGAGDWPFTRQYRNTTAYIYFIEQQVRWGLGWALGLLAWGGFAWAILRGLGGKIRAGEAIVLAWLVPYFGLNGLFLAKFMRYMSPVTPLIIVLGVGMLIMATRSASQNWRGARPLGASIALVILLATGIWAAMFVNGVYATEHSWITTSRWIYDNVPDGACIAREHWEEGVPRDWAWREPGMAPYLRGYQQPQMPMYEADTPEKFALMRDTLRNCDYLVIASNRMSRTLPRLSERYPLSTAYYEALFDEKLGYELAFEHETPPRLGNFVIDDQPADESFTVYDHPKSFVFQKTRDLSDEEWFSILGNTWIGAVHGYVGEPTLMMRLRGADNVPTLNGTPRGDSEVESTWLQKPLSAWPVVTDWRWNATASENPLQAVIIWLAAIFGIGLVAFPITFLLFHRLADRGYLFSKSIGLLLISYSTWLLASVGLPANRLIVIVASLLILALVSLFMLLRHWAQIANWWRTHWRYVILGELIFIAIFGLFTSFRMANPDLWQPWNGGEKMLEIGFLNAIVKSAYMPPYDPFFAGTFMNYYYYGLFMVGVMIKLTGIEPTVAFNLAVPLLAALTGVSVFGLAANLARRAAKTPISQGVFSGLMAVLFVLIFSNLDGMGQLLRSLAEISDSRFTTAIPGLETLVRAGSGISNALNGEPIRQYDWWAVSRIIPTTINEFPFWSYLFADLHPHMIGIPITVLFLALVYGWLKSTPTQESISSPPPFSADAAIGPGTFAMEIDIAAEDLPYRPKGTGATSFWEELRYIAIQEWTNLGKFMSFGSIFRWLAIPFVLGAIGLINLWDMPTYAGLIIAAFAISRYRAGLRPLTLTRAVIMAVEVLGFGILLVGATLVMYRPFFASYVPLAGGLGLIRDKTPLDEFFKLWGFFMLVLFAWLAWQTLQPQSRFAPLRAVSLFIRRWNVLPHLTEIYRAVVTKDDESYNLALAGISLLLAAVVILAAFGYVVVALLIIWTLLALLLLLRWEVSAEQSYIELLAFTGLLILLGVQFVFLEDWLAGGDSYRMNTFFKFFIQVWVMFGVAAGVMMPMLWTQSERWARGWRWLWQGLVVIFVFSSMVFFVLGTRQRLDNRFPGARPEIASLDGLDFMTVGRFEFEFPYGSRTYNPIDLRYDHEAIRWLLDNVQGTPIIAEAKIGYYREAGMRVAGYTGLPSVLGGLHQNEQHPPRQIGERDGLVREFWDGLDLTRTMALANQLQIEYIYFGQLERVVYGDQDATKFVPLVQQGALDLVFENAQTKIYQVVR